MSGAPSATPATPALCELTGVSSVRYRLSTVPEPPFDGGSTISILDPHLEREFPPPRPLAGTIDFVPLRPLPAGARFAVTLAGYALESDGFGAHSAQLPFAIDGAITASLDEGAGVVASLVLVDFGLANQAAPADTIGDGCPRRSRASSSPARPPPTCGR